MRSAGKSANGGRDAGKLFVCDAHVHLWAENPPLPEYVVVPDFSANLSALVAVMDENGIDQAAVVTPRAMGWDNSITSAAARAHSERIVAIGLVNPLASRPEEELLPIMRSGFAGMRFSPSNEPEQTWLTGQALSRFWHTADDGRFPVHLHIAPHQLPQVRTIAQEFKNVPLVIDHLGRPDVEAGTDAAQFRAFLSLAEYPNLWAKTPSSGFFSKSQPPFLDLVPFLQAALEAYGSSRILWGSDWPGALTYGSYRDSLEPWFSNFPDLDSQSRANLFGLNFMRLYRGAPPATETVI
jgi:L-fuconolactonase